MLRGISYDRLKWPWRHQFALLGAPDAEFRATFVASAFNVDFPINPSDSTDSEKAQLDAFVDSVDSINFNAIMFQVTFSFTFSG